LSHLAILRERDQMKSLRALVTLTVLGSAIWAVGETQMKLSSSAFSEGSNIPPKFTCDGADTSPPLKIEAVPDSTRALVLIVDDPDAPGGLFTHWVVWNVDPKASSVPAGKAPGGTQGTNDFGHAGYGGPCPPSGTHRYYFKIFALDQQLSLSAGAKRKEVDAAINGHVIGQAQLMGRYVRKQ
jgi:Raf kinase inhibitor-like YbhB/YbcL family protein